MNRSKNSLNTSLLLPPKMSKLSSKIDIAEMAALAQGLTVDHIARRSKDIRRLADFYIELFGFEEVESPKVGPLNFMWLVKPSAFTLHLVECNPTDNSSQSNTTAAVAEVADIPENNHICFSVSNFKTFVEKLQEKGIKTAHRPVEYNPTGSKEIDQVFFFDPDGNGLEVSDANAPKWVAPDRILD